MNLSILDVGGSCQQIVYLIETTLFNQVKDENFLLDCLVQPLCLVTVSILVTCRDRIFHRLYSIPAAGCGMSTVLNDETWLLSK